MQGKMDFHTQVPSNLVAKVEFELAKVSIVDRSLGKDPIVVVDIVYQGHKMHSGFVLSKASQKGMVFLVRFLLPYKWLAAQEKLGIQMWGALVYTGHKPL